MQDRIARIYREVCKRSRNDDNKKPINRKRGTKGENKDRIPQVGCNLLVSRPIHRND